MTTSAVDALTGAPSGEDAPGAAPFDPARLWALRAELIGAVLVPGDAGYDEARQVYNGMVDKCPVLIAQCRGVADVQAAVRFAVWYGLPVAVRGGGHSVAGHGTADDAVLVDLRAMRAVHVDPDTATAWVQGGATLRDVDAETQVYGLALPTGQVSATGVAGLTLNGGMGMLQRKYGLTCDNLIEARVVTATGEVVAAAEHADAELLWALRGGGGNFGVVTEFRYRLHPVGPIMLAGLVGFAVEDAPDVLRFLRDYIATAPEELSADAIFQSAPPLDAIPEQYRGRRIIGIFIRWCGRIEDGWEAIRPIQRFGDPVLDFVGPMPLTTVQSMLDPINPPGNRHYWTAEFLPDLDTASVEAVSAIGSSLPSRESIVEVIPFNGAVTRVDEDATAFSHREDSWLIHVLCQWSDRAETDRCRAWARAAGADLRSVGMQGRSYLNLITADETDNRVTAFWDDARMRRLRATKTRHDPGNVFRFNHNIAPYTEAESP